MEDTGFRLVYVPVRRLERAKTYRPDHYEVAVTQNTLRGYRFLFHRVRNESQNFHKLIESIMKEEYGIPALSVHEITATDGSSFNSEPCIDILYAVPTTIEEGFKILQSNVLFVKVSELLKSPASLHDHHKDLLLALDKWLYERHAIPYSNPDLMFTPDSMGHSLVGTVFCVVDNPLRNSQEIPSEDSLIIGLNNPVFKPVTSTD